MKRSLLLFLALSGAAWAADVVDSRAAELARLRREVETLESDLVLRKEDLRAQLKAVEAQKMEVEVQVRREELRLAQIEGDAASRRAEIEAHTAGREDLGPGLAAAITQVRAGVERGLPFRVPDRLAELDTLARQLESHAVTPEAAGARLWAFCEDELRMTRENALDRQIVRINGQDVLADVARLGMVGLYFHTDGGQSGAAVREGDAWTWKTYTDRDDQKAVETLFEKLRHGVRNGGFTLPNPGVGT